MNEIIQIVIKYLIEAAAVVVVFAAGKYVIPWLKEKRIWDYIVQFVEMAEQKADAGFINPDARKDEVIKALQNVGIKITEEILDLIESAVCELNMEKKKAEKLPDNVTVNQFSAPEQAAPAGDTASEAAGEPAAEETVPAE